VSKARVTGSLQQFAGFYEWVELVHRPHLNRADTLAQEVAQKRVQTALNRMLPKEGKAAEAELTSALEKLGL
jgi:hypothetical protein